MNITEKDDKIPEGLCTKKKDPNPSDDCIYVKEESDKYSSQAEAAAEYHYSPVLLLPPKQESDDESISDNKDKIFVFKKESKEEASNINSTEKDVRIPEKLCIKKEDPDPLGENMDITEESLEYSAQGNDARECNFSPTLLVSPKRESGDETKVREYQNTKSPTKKQKLTEDLPHSDKRSSACEDSPRTRTKTKDGDNKYSKPTSLSPKIEEVYIEDFPYIDDETSTYEGINLGEYQYTKTEEGDNQYSKPTSLSPTIEEVFIEDLSYSDDERSSACEDTNFEVYQDTNTKEGDNQYSKPTSLSPTIEEVFIEDPPYSDDEVPFHTTQSYAKQKKRKVVVGRLRCILCCQVKARKNVSSVCDCKDLPCPRHMAVVCEKCKDKL